MNHLLDRRAVLAEHARLGIKPISGGDQTNGEPAGPGNTEGQPGATGTTGATGTSNSGTGTFTQEDVNRLVGAAREEGRNAERDKVKKDQEEAERKRKQEEETKAGNYQKVIDDLTKDRDDYKAKLEAAEAQLTKWNERANKEIDEKVGEIKKKNPALAELDPGGDDTFKRYDWLGKALKVVGELKDDKGGGNPPNPPVGNGGAPTPDKTYEEYKRYRGIRVR